MMTLSNTKVRKIKRAIAFVISMLIALTAPVAVFADTSESSTMPDEYNIIHGEFVKGTFSDVYPMDWCYESIKEVYNAGIMVGKTESTFEPWEPVTLAETITAVVRMNAILTGKVRTSDIIENTNEPWYSGIVKEAISLGIIKDKQFVNYEVSATRAEVAGIVSEAIPDTKIKYINNIKKLPDVDEKDKYGKQILRLYRAGILTGNDSYGTFRPHDAITRAELAQIICRVIKEEERQGFSITYYPEDYTVYTTDKTFTYNGMALYGVARIEDEYYFPIEILNKLRDYNKYYRVLDGTHDVTYRVQYKYKTTPDKVLGVAENVDGNIEFHNSSGKKIASARIVGIDGEYQMMRLSDLGLPAKVEDNAELVFNTLEDTEIDLKDDEDIIGDSLGSLIKDNDRDTVEAIHDWIIQEINYNPVEAGQDNVSNNKRNIIETAVSKAKAKHVGRNNIVLDSGYGICADYADLMLEMCIRAGIPCTEVSGTGNSVGHAWNKVYIDGKWEYVDATWDDTGSGAIDTYLLADVETMAYSHWWDGTDYPMEYSFKDEWYGMLDDEAQTTVDFRKALIAQIRLSNTHFEIKVADADCDGGLAFLDGFLLDKPYKSISYSYSPKKKAYEFYVTY